MGKATQIMLRAVPTAQGVEFGLAWREETWQPRIDVCQTEDGLEVEIEAAGLSEDSLRLHFEAGHLVVEGRREREMPCTPTRCLQVEIEYGAFRRAVPMPPEADIDGIRAAYEAGMLHVVVPFKQPAKLETRRVNIS